MEQLTFSNGHKIPQLGLGTFLAKDEDKLTVALEKALEIGYRHIDCAAIYKNEAVVGNVLGTTSIPREELFITSKLWVTEYRYEDAKKALAQTLEDLQLDYLDLYLLHWPDEHVGEAWKALEEAYESGLVKAIGVSNFHEHHLEELFRFAKIKPMINQVEAHPYFPQNELKTYCHDHGMLFEAWGPFSQGKSDLLENPVLVKIANTHHKSVAQVVLRWHLQVGNVVIPKSTTPSRLEENFNVFDFKLDDNEMLQIASIATSTRFGTDPDTKPFTI